MFFKFLKEILFLESGLGTTSTRVDFDLNDEIEVSSSYFLPFLKE
jgi:hypothetical protein